MSLLITYFMEPRAVKYDPDMSILLPTETNFSPGPRTAKFGTDGDFQTPTEPNPNIPKVIFILPEEKLEISSEAGSTEEINKRLGSIIPKDLPVRLKARWHDGANFVHLEIWSIEAVQVIEKSLRDVLVMGSGNVYLWQGANFLEFMHTRLSGMYTGGVGKFQTGINLAAQFLHSVEGKIRDNVMASKWINATDETVKQVLQKETASKIAHMNENLVRRLAQSTAAGSSEKVLEFEKARTAKWIADAESKLNAALAKIDKSLLDLNNSRAFKSAPDNIKATMRLETAERVAQRSIWRLDNWLKGVVIGVSVYYIVEGVVQWTRAETKSEAEKIAQIYGVKAANNLLYAVPGVNGLAFAWNVTVAGLNFGGDKLFDYDFPDLSTERGLNYLVDSSNDVGFYLGGTTRFAFNRDNLNIKHGLFPLFKTELGYWSGVELKRLEVALGDAKDNTQTNAALKTFGDEVRAIGLKNLMVLYSLKNENLNEREYNQYLSDLEQKWVSSKLGYSTYLRLVAGY